MKEIDLRKSLVRMLSGLLLSGILASCHPSAPADGPVSSFTEYQIVRMSQPDSRTTDGRLESEFEDECGRLLKEGWLPAGGVQITFKTENQVTPMTYSQAFYR